MNARSAAWTAVLGLVSVAGALFIACGDEAPDYGASGEQPNETDGAPETPLAGGSVSCATALPPGAIEPGTDVTVRGVVANVRPVQSEQGPLTLLEMGVRDGSVPFAVGVLDRRDEDFPDPESTYEGNEICVNGVVAEYQGIPTIYVVEPEEIVITNAPSGPSD